MNIMENDIYLLKFKDYIKTEQKDTDKIYKLMRETLSNFAYRNVWDDFYIISMPPKDYFNNNSLIFWDIMLVVPKFVMYDPSRDQNINDFCFIHPEKIMLNYMKIKEINYDSIN